MAPNDGASPKKAPLSQKGGWGDFPPPCITKGCVLPANPTVIPAKAGIHSRPLYTPGPTGVLDSGLRRDDSGVQEWRPMMAQALKSPPFAKGGLGGFPPAAHHETPRPDGRLLDGGSPPARASAEFGLSWGLGEGEIPPTPLLRKGGFSRLAPSFRAIILIGPSSLPTVPHRHSCPHRHSRESGNPPPAFPQFGANRGFGFRPPPE